MTQSLRIVTGAVVAGIISFVILYITLALGLVFALSLLPEWIDAGWVEDAFKVLGLLALLFPGYAAARIAGRNGLLHGLLTGAACSVISAVFLMHTFSWEGTYRQVVWLAMVKIAVVGITMAGLGGLLGNWLNSRNRRKTGRVTQA